MGFKKQNKQREKIRERETNQETLLIIENKLMEERRVRGFRMHFHDEHQGAYGSVESLYRTPETNITMSANWN